MCVWVCVQIALVYFIYFWILFFSLFFLLSSSNQVCLPMSMLSMFVCAGRSKLCILSWIPYFSLPSDITPKYFTIDYHRLYYLIDAHTLICFPQVNSERCILYKNVSSYYIKLYDYIREYVERKFIHYTNDTYILTYILTYIEVDSRHGSQVNMISFTKTVQGYVHT